MSESSSLAAAHAARGAIREYIETYLRHRPAGRFVGEFVDEHGWENQQAGLGGSCFLAHYEMAENLQPPRLDYVWATIQAGMGKERADWSPEEARILRDIPRLAIKAVLLALAPNQTVDSRTVISRIFASADSSGLIRSVLDDPASRGDPVATSYVLHLLRIGGKAHSFLTEANAALPELRRLVREGSLDLYERLFVSTALCLYDFVGSIDDHLDILKELYQSEDEWHRSFSSNSPFLDHRFNDVSAHESANRYLRIPRGYIILSAIYMAFGSERKFFNFPPIRKLVCDIKKPLSAHVGRDRNKASVYYLWFTYVALNPSKYLTGAVQGPLRRLTHWISYQIHDLTSVGVAVFLLSFLGLFGVLFFTIKLLQGGMDQFDELLGAIGTLLSAALGLMKTRKR
jgi:hypothetical protein